MAKPKSKVPASYTSRARYDKPGTIGVQSGELSRFADFSRALVHLGRPEGTQLIWIKSIDIVGSANKIIQGMKGDWLWLMGDDHVFDPDILQRLLAHDVDVVVPLCLQRYPPFAPVVYSGQDPKSGSFYVHDHLPEHGLVEVHASGDAGMLIKKHVLDAIPPPHYETEGKGLNQDVNFCKKIKAAGFKIYVDVDTVLGHINTYTVWPTRNEYGWAIGLQLDADNTITLNRAPTAPPVSV
jgi:hypothetical protein